jgi:cytochrome b561
MIATNDLPTYPAAAKRLHWLIVILVAIQFVTAYLLPHIGRNTAPSTGIIALPAIAQPGASWANQAGDIHSTAMWALLWLVGLHAGAALYHHVIRRDGTLRRMLP